MELEVRQNVIEDETNYLISIDAVETNYLSMEKGNKHVDAWARYPENWKISNFWITTAPERYIISRQTYSLFDLFGDVGGALQLIQIFVGAFVSQISGFNLTSMIANRFYTRI